MKLDKHLKNVLKAYETKKTSDDFMPAYYGIEVTRHCNLACKMCPHPLFKKEDKGHMDEQIFKRIIDKIKPYAKLIKLHWIGEPLMHKNIINMISYAKENTSARLQISTNATLLKGDLATQIRESGVDMLTISIDGNSIETYENIRVKGSYSKVINNVESFLTDVIEKGGPTCHVKMITFKENEHEIESFRDKWSKFEGVGVEIMWLSDWAGNVKGLDSNTVLTNPIQEKNRVPCSDLWFKMQIDWTGQVALCCFDAMKSVVIGDISKSSLKDIWNSNNAIRIRNEHINKAYSGICDKCSDWATPNEYEFWYTLEEIAKDPKQIWG